MKFFNRKMTAVMLGGALVLVSAASCQRRVSAPIAVESSTKVTSPPCVASSVPEEKPEKPKSTEETASENPLCIQASEWIIQGLGIGRATVEGNAIVKPPVVMKIKLQGLEMLRVRSGDREWHMQILSHEERRVIQEWSRGGGEPKDIEPGHPDWVEVQVKDEHGNLVQGAPPLGGWFEFTVPKDLLQPGVPTQLQWVDFYR